MQLWLWTAAYRSKDATTTLPSWTARRQALLRPSSLSVGSSQERGVGPASEADLPCFGHYAFLCMHFILVVFFQQLMLVLGV